jgi:hypothetical protein
MLIRLKKLHVSGFYWEYVVIFLAYAPRPAFLDLPIIIGMARH